MDKAADVEEALHLLGQYDVHASADTEHRFALANAKGRFVVLEYIQNKMLVTKAPVITTGSHYGLGSVFSF